jgi:predicted RNase H-like HicB family nuclease
MDLVKAEATRYAVAVHRMPGYYLARVKNLPGCVCRGATPVEAVESVRAALQAHLLLAKVLSSGSTVVELEITA